MFPPRVEQWRSSAPGQFVALYGDISERELNRLARDYRDEIAQLPNGSSIVQLWGDKNEEVSIEVSEDALQRFGLTFDDVANAIRASSLNLSGGQVRTDTGNVQVATRNLADTAEEFERIIIRQQPDGSVIRVADVATVIDGFEDVKLKREVMAPHRLAWPSFHPKKSISSRNQKPSKAGLRKRTKNWTVKHKFMSGSTLPTSSTRV